MKKEHYNWSKGYNRKAEKRNVRKETDLFSNVCGSIDSAKKFIKMNHIEDPLIIVLWKEEYEI